MRKFSSSSLATISREELDELEALVRTGHRFKIFYWGKLVACPLEEESQWSQSVFYFVQPKEWLVTQRVGYTCLAAAMTLFAAILGEPNNLFGALSGVVRNPCGGKDVTDYVLVVIRRNLHLVSRDASASEFLKTLTL